MIVSGSCGLVVRVLPGIEIHPTHGCAATNRTQTRLNCSQAMVISVVPSQLSLRNLEDTSFMITTILVCYLSKQSRLEDSDFYQHPLVAFDSWFQELKYVCQPSTVSGQKCLLRLYLRTCPKAVHAPFTAALVEYHGVCVAWSICRSFCLNPLKAKKH